MYNEEEDKKQTEKFFRERLDWILKIITESGSSKDKFIQISDQVFEWELPLDGN